MFRRKTEMLSKEDYKNYLDQIVRLENKMSEVYKGCTDRVEADVVKDICAGLSNAEKQHALIVKELINLFDI
jgi:rubrerythrin